MAENDFLQLAWFFLVGFLLVGYAILDGFDLGVGMQHLVIARTDEERRTLMNSIGPVWDGNEVWLVTAGGALFAAFPKVYATAFSGFYLALMLVLVALMLRAVSIEFRSKVTGRLWRFAWDVAFSVGSLVPAVLFGVALGNVMRGIPLDANGDYAGSFAGLLSPFALTVGLLSASVFLAQGSAWLMLKTEGALAARARWMAGFGITATIGLWIAVTLWSRTEAPGLWNAFDGILPWAAPAVYVAGLATACLAIRVGRAGIAFLGTSSAIAAMVATLGLGLWPNLMPARGTGAPLTVAGTASSDLTLTVMLIVAIVGMPLVLAYTAWTYRAFRGKVRLEDHAY
jgi:cytochrome d ubiquinol oxidase subunit II